MNNIYFNYSNLNVNLECTMQLLYAYLFQTREEGGLQGTSLCNGVLSQRSRGQESLCKD